MISECDKWIDSVDLDDSDDAIRGWIAALKWCLSEEHTIGYSVPVVLTDIIRKELKELNAN